MRQTQHFLAEEYSTHHGGIGESDSSDNTQGGSSGGDSGFAPIEPEPDEDEAYVAVLGQPGLCAGPHKFKRASP